MLMKEVLPILSATVPRRVRPVGNGEDFSDLLQDGTLQAAEMISSRERRGLPLPPAGSVVWYVVQSLRSGRRSGCGGRQDVLSPAATLDKRVQIASLDAPAGATSDDPDGDMSLADTLVAPGEDAGTEAGRKLDWDLIVSQLDFRQQGILMATAEGRGPSEMAVVYEVSAPRICQLREELGEYITAAWGSNGLVDCTTAPVWKSGMRAAAERRAGRRERAFVA